MGFRSEVRDVLRTIRREAADLSLALLDVRAKYRAGEWEAWQDDDRAGNVFVLLTAPVVGLLWAWAPAVRRWAERNVRRQPT